MRVRRQRQLVEQHPLAPVGFALLPLLPCFLRQGGAAQVPVTAEDNLTLCRYAGFRLGDGLQRRSPS